MRHSLAIYSFILCFSLLCFGVLEGCSGSTVPEKRKKKLKEYPLDNQLRLNHIQVKGTHNSYHIKPEANLKDWFYTHAPLDVQLEKQGVRQFELDLYWGKTEKALKVFHITLLDQETTCNLFTDCLKVMKKWSDEHPQHLPIFVMIETKDAGKAFPVPDPYEYKEVEQAILSVWPKERLLTPDSIRGKHASLKEAIRKDGWPTLGEVRGKAIFFLLAGGDRFKIYTNDRKHLRNRLMFATGPLDAPYTVITKVDDPIKDMKKIQKAVKEGMIIRTRSDATDEPWAKDYKRFEAALKSGAQMISTDFPARVPKPDFVIRIPKGNPARCNPISSPKNCTSKALEDEP